MVQNIKVGIVLRVSTLSQSIESQKQPLLQYCEQNNYQVVEIYEDSGNFI